MRPAFGTVDVFAICYNEEFFLPYFIHHYQKHFGANITIYDNNSTDKSREIIEQFGCNYVAYDSGDQIRDDIYLSIKNECWKKSKADWVIVCDIDELIEVDFDVSKCTIVRTKGYDMFGIPPSRLGEPNIMYNKRIMFRPSQFRQIGYQPGCHNCLPEGNNMPSVGIANLLHYKYISEEYVYKKHLLYQSRLSDFNKKYGFGIEYDNVKLQSIRNKIESIKKNGIEVPKAGLEPARF